MFEQRVCNIIPYSAAQRLKGLTVASTPYPQLSMILPVLVHIIQCYHNSIIAICSIQVLFRISYNCICFIYDWNKFKRTGVLGL